MGYNTVAVLYNDANFKNDSTIGERLQDAIRGWSWRDRDHLATNFGSGVVVSQAHADYSQVVVVGRNTGQPLSECNDLDYLALDQIADALRRHGWTVKPPKREKSK